MKLNALTPMLTTPNLDASIAFYTDILGFMCAARSDKHGWAHMERDRVSVMLATPNPHVPFENPIFTGSLYFYTDDVDGQWEQLKDRVEVSYPIESFDYGMREFAIYDDNGYLLQFGQEIAIPEEEGD